MRPAILVWSEHQGPQHAVTVREADDPHGEGRCYVRIACGMSGYVFESHLLDGRDEDVTCAGCHKALGLEERVGLTELGWAAVSK